MTSITKEDGLIPGSSFFESLHLRSQRFLTNFVPKRVKRLVFLASVIGFIMNQKDVHPDLLKKLNQVLKLASEDKALILPIMFHSRVWKVKDPYVALDGRVIYFKDLCYESLIKEEYLNIAEFFLHAAPSWIVYGSKRFIARDLEVFFKHY